MTLLAFVIGVGLPTLAGWLLLRVFEGPAPFLLRLERWALGFLVGTTLSMFLFFLAQTTFGMPLTAVRMTSMLAGACILLLLPLYRYRAAWRAQAVPATYHLQPVTSSPPRWAMLTLKTLVTASAAKILFAGVTFLMLTPPFLDDVIENWNLRAKVFLHDRALTLVLPGQDPSVLGGGVNAYPPTVPLAKAWLNILAGGAWNEALANSLHLLWFAAAAVLLWSLLRRMLSQPWALLGTYLFLSLPLVTMHATNPYADIFLGAHVFAVGSMLASALLTTISLEQRRAALRVAAVALCCLPFTKNEGLVLYLGPAVLAFLATLALLWRREAVSRRDIVRAGATAAIVLFAVLVPWLLYKWDNALAFGNAKGISGLEIAFEPLVLLAIAVNTFLEGNWIFLFPLLILLLLLRGTYALRGPLLPLTILIALPYAGQLGIFSLTGLSTEALRQTGYARGVMHLVPMMVVLATALLAKTGIAKKA